MYGALAPGPALMQMNVDVLNKMAQFVNGLAADGKAQQIGLFRWIRDSLSMSSSRAVFGPEDPLTKNPSLLDDLW
jgi:hypothetical protein